MGISFYERILLEIRKRREHINDTVMSGNLLHEEYKSFTGRFNGLEEAEDAVKSAYKALFENKEKE